MDSLLNLNKWKMAKIGIEAKIKKICQKNKITNPFIDKFEQEKKIFKILFLKKNRIRYTKV